MRRSAKFIGYLGLLCILSMAFGCATTNKPVVHTVPYQSDVACAVDSTDCNWKRLEQQAKDSALINCLLSGATVLQTEPVGKDPSDKLSIIVPIPPKYGYEFVIKAKEIGPCRGQESACMVASRNDLELTWAGCGPESLGEEKLRGGEDRENADQLTERAVVTGSLMVAANTFKKPAGLDGPDQFYTFTLEKETYVETAVAANSSDWSATKGHRAPWQPGLFLLADNGQTIRTSHLWRAGVSYVLPLKLPPGTYYLVVDSSQREFSRGDGLYRLYLGRNNNHLGSFHPQ